VDRSEPELREIVASGSNWIEVKGNLTGAGLDGEAFRIYYFEESTSGGRPHSVIGNPYMFQGQRYDEESSLYYFKNRYYDPEHGGFLSRDPKGFVDGPNLYAFVNNNPINYVDPMGLRSLSEIKEAKQSEKAYWERRESSLWRLEYDWRYLAEENADAYRLATISGWTARGCYWGLAAWTVGRVPLAKAIFMHPGSQGTGHLIKGDRAVTGSLFDSANKFNDMRNDQIQSATDIAIRRAKERVEHKATMTDLRAERQAERCRKIHIGTCEYLVALRSRFVESSMEQYERDLVSIDKMSREEIWYKALRAGPDALSHARSVGSLPGTGHKMYNTIMSHLRFMKDNSLDYSWFDRQVNWKGDKEFFGYENYAKNRYVFQEDINAYRDVLKQEARRSLTISEEHLRYWKTRLAHFETCPWRNVQYDFKNYPEPPE
jgi:RHS repeat-associated protein